MCVCVCVYIYIYTYTTGYKGVMTRERTAERGALPLVQGEGVEEEAAVQAPGELEDYRIFPVSTRKAKGMADT